MPVTLGTIAGTNSASGTSVTRASFVVPSGTDALIARVWIRNSSGTAMTGVTFNGSENFTQIGSTINQNTLYISFWYLANPTATTADVVATWNGNHSGARVSVQTVDDIDTGTPYGTLASATNANTVNVTSVAGDMVVDAAGHSQSAGTATEGAGQTTDEINTTLGGTTYYGHASHEEATGTTTTMSRTWGSPATGIVIGVALKPAAGSGLGNKLTGLLGGKLTGKVA